MKKILKTEGANGLLLVSPTFIYAFLLLAVPIAAVVTFSFWTQNYLDLDTTFTLDNYRAAAQEPIYRVLLFRSLKISAIVTLATVILAFPIAYYISFFVPANRKALWIFLITVPFWTSYLLRIFLWKVILGYNGVLNSGLKGLGLIDEPLTFILNNMNAVVITLAHAWAPFAILPIYVVLEKIDRSLLEASYDLGESRLITFMRVTLPLALPGILAAAVIVFIPTIGDYVTPKLVGGPSGLMISNMIQLQFLKANNAPLGATLAILAMLAVVVTLALLWIFGKLLTWFNRNYFGILR
jgi:spermidine/putrescine transport system permease protein